MSPTCLTQKIEEASSHHPASLGNCRLKQLTRYRLHWPEWLQSKTSMMPNSDTNTQQQELSVIAGGNAKWRSLFVRQIGGFWQNWTQSHHTIQHLCSLVFTQVEYVCPHKNLYINVYSSIIHNHHKRKWPRCPSWDERIKKLWYIHTWNIIRS